MSILNKEKMFEQARLFVEEGRFDKAIKEYEKIALADPQDMRVKLNIAELHVKLKQVSDAIRVYREVASNYTQQGFYLKAVTVYKSILRLNPSLIEVNGRLAELYEQMGLHADAVRQYEIYAGALENKGELARLMEVRKKIVELLPEDGSARIRYAELLQREGKGEDAIDQYEEYARRLERSGGNEARLIEMYEKVLSYRSDRSDMLRNLVHIYFRNGEIKKALKWLEFAKSLTAVDVELLEMQANIYLRLNQIETARTKMLMLSELHREQGDTAKAAEVLAHIASAIPSEEERVRRRAEEIGGDAVQTFDAALARFLREAQETREIEERATTHEEAHPAASPLKREAEPRAKPKPIPVKPAPAKAKPPPPMTKPKAAVEKPAASAPERDRTIIVPVEQEKLPKPVSAKKAMSTDQLLREAKAAYNLAMLYEQLGLKDESKREFLHALERYKGAALSPVDRERVREIGEKLGIATTDIKGTERAPSTSAKSASPAKTRSMKETPVKNRKRKTP